MSELDLSLFVLGFLVLVFTGAIMVIQRMLEQHKARKTEQQPDDLALRIREQYERECG